LHVLASFLRLGWLETRLLVTQTLQNQELFKNGMVDPHQGCGKLAQASETNDPNNMGNGYDGALFFRSPLAVFFSLFSESIPDYVI